MTETDRDRKRHRERDRQREREREMIKRTKSGPTTVTAMFKEMTGFGKTATSWTNTHISACTLIVASPAESKKSFTVTVFSP